MVLLIIFLSLCVIVSIIATIEVVYISQNDVGFCLLLSSFCSGFLLMLLLNSQSNKNEIKPIDVYRGNTELQITYTIQNNDTINCDTIVVYKKDE